MLAEAPLSSNEGLPAPSGTVRAWFHSWSQAGSVADALPRGGLGEELVGLPRGFYEIHFWTDEDVRTPVTFVCDEAHLYLPASVADPAEQRALESFERIAKEGRKYGISLLVVSQRPSDVSRTVLSQCNTFVVLRLTNDQDQAVVKRLMPDSMEGIAAALPLLDVGEALLLGDAIILPTRIRLDPPKVKPASATRNFWTEWNETSVEDSDLVAAVEAMRAQTRTKA